MMKLVNVLALLVLLLSCIAVSHANYWEVEDVEATVPPTTTEAAATTPVAGTTPEGTTPEGTTPEGTTPEGTTPEGTSAGSTSAAVTTTEATVTTTESSSGAETTKSGGGSDDGSTTTTQAATSTQQAANTTQAASTAAASTAAASTAAPAVTSTAAASTAAHTSAAPSVAQPGDVIVTASFGMRTEKHRSEFPLSAFDASIATGLNVTRANVHSTIKNATRKRADEFTVVTSIILRASEASRTATIASSLNAAANNTAVAQVLASAGAQVTSVSVSTAIEPPKEDNINGGASGKNMGFAVFAVVASVFAFAL